MNELRHEKTNNAVSEHVQHKPACSLIRRLDARDFEKRDCPICASKTKALISFAVTAKLVCAFVFA